MKTFLLVALLFASAARGQPTDAPVAGALLPAPGSDAERIALAQVITACKVENTDLKVELRKQMHPLVFVGIIVGTAVAASLITFGAVKAAEPPK